MVQDLDQAVNDWPLDAQLLGQLGLHHCSDDLHINWDINSGTVELVKVVH